MSTDDIVAMFAFAQNKQLYVSVLLNKDDYQLLNHALCYPPIPTTISDYPKLPAVTIPLASNDDYYLDFPVESTNSSNGTLQLIGPKGTASFTVEDAS